MANTQARVFTTMRLVSPPNALQTPGAVYVTAYKPRNHATENIKQTIPLRPPKTGTRKEKSTVQELLL